MSGLKIACLYSFGCPELIRLKNEPEIASRDPLLLKTVYDFITGNFSGNEKRFRIIRDILERLDPFFCYQLIARINGISDPFNEEVVRDYWLGVNNFFLKPVEKEDVEVLLKEGKFPFGFPVEFERHKIMAVISKVRNLIGIKPYHNFIVLQPLTNLRKRKEVSEKILAEINKCLVRPAEIIEEENDFFRVKTLAIIEFNQTGIFLLKDTEEKINRGFIKEGGKGKFISLHLGGAREIISGKEFSSLTTIIEEAIKFF